MQLLRWGTLLVVLALCGCADNDTGTSSPAAGDTAPRPTASAPPPLPPDHSPALDSDQAHLANEPRGERTTIERARRAPLAADEDNYSRAH